MTTQMDAKRWERVKDICLAASEQEKGARGAYLDSACEGDDPLRAEVESLLDQFEDEPEFLEEPIVRISGGLPAPREDDRPNRIGEYEIVRPLGHGGMGEVFLAIRDRGDFRQSVALKVIRRGMDTDDVLTRFRVERRILASLHHPNIAQLVDGGATEDGRPYFVMEYIEGTPLDAYCDRRRLSIKQRLELFQIVCGAVQHAHQNLVVHRDIKPSNILVDADGTPKLLDFGIGKVLAPDPVLGAAVETRTEVRLLTPEYASPEQVRGEAITTATDVYGLGILLYHLLTGHHPYLSGELSRAEIEEAVCEREPTPPSTAVVRTEQGQTKEGAAEQVTPEDVANRRASDPLQLRRRLSGDLDTIVLKALRKEQHRRYHSAAALANDIQRHLEGLPVKARPDTLGYRAEKFLRRNAWKVAAVAVAFIALGATSIVTKVQSGRVTDERNRALEERDKALEVRSFLLEMFGGTAADESTDGVTVRQLLDRQVGNLAELYGDEPVQRAEMMEVLAEAYERLGLYEDAETLARDALVTRRNTLGPGHPDIARSLNLLGWILTQRGESAEARPMLEEAVAIRRTSGDRYRGELSRSLNDLGIVLERLGDLAAAEQAHSEAMQIRLAEYGAAHRSVGITANNIAVLSYRLGRNDSAVYYGEQAVRSLRLALGDDHQRSVMAQTNLAAIKARAGDYAAAEVEYRDLLERQRRLQGPDHPMVAIILHNLGNALTRQDKDAEAERYFREALAAREKRLGPIHPDVASSLSGIANALVGQGRIAEAIELQLRAVAVESEVSGARSPDVGIWLEELAEMYAQAHDDEAAETTYRDALDIFQASLSPPGHSRTVEAMTGLSRTLLRSGQEEEGLAYAVQAHELALPRPNSRLGRETRLELAQAYLVVGDYTMADSLLTIAEQDEDGDEESPSDQLAELRDQLNRARSATQ